MHELYEFLLSRSGGVIGRLAAGALIGTIVSVAAVSRDGSFHASPVAIAGGCVGFLAVGLLEIVDARRRIRERRGLPTPTLGERALGCAVVVGCVLGVLSALCGIAMAVVRGIEIVRGK